jgi:hypothetical protein
VNAPYTPLIADIFTALMADNHATTNALIEGLTARASEAEAELDAVRAGILELISGRYMPTPAAIESALWPDGQTVAQYTAVNR